MPLRTTLEPVGRILHALALYALASAALVVLAATTLAAFGVLPWLTVSAGFGEASYPHAGMVAQVGVTTLLCLLVAFIPSSNRMLALEQSHRNFRMTMTDVAKAYHSAHMADRTGVFTLSSEFDQVRERIDYLRSHPDLKLLEADVLTMAAQMSQQSHQLAVVYSDERVARAKDFLAQRQKEVDDQQVRIAEAQQVCRDILRWTSQVEQEEATVADELQKLEAQLRTALPALDLGLDGARLAQATSVQMAARADNIVPMPNSAAMPVAAAEEAGFEEAAKRERIG